MTLANMVQEKLSTWQPSDRAPLTVAGATGWTAVVIAERNDTMSTLLWELQLQSAAGQTSVSPREWAKQICQRVTGLLEPLKVLEVDETRCEALLRSQKTSERNGAICYYEVLLRGTQQALVRRYQAAHASKAPRHQVAYALTHEAMAKLIEDICG